MNKTKTVSLCMIVKDEETYLSDCLNSVKDIVDEMIIVDTGSTDRTVEIAKSFSAKVFNYTWDSNFSNARNFSISQATCDWILLLDADEVFELEDTNKFIEFINTSTADGCHFLIQSYSGEASNLNSSLHYAFRLLRNNHQYHFIGSIHEQIVRIDEDTSKYNLVNENIRLHHYGYLSQVVRKKNKRSRNIPIIMKQLESEPHNPFYLFNLGNEYISSTQQSKALEYYTEAKKYIIPNQAFVPHLYYRMVMCCYSLKFYSRGLQLANEALTLYPNCTDIEYCKGMIFYATHRYTLAIKCFNNCLEMGEPPTTLKFSEGCGTYRPYIFLGEIYTYLEDYDEALKSFTNALNVDPSLYGILYQCGHLLKLKYTNSQDINSTLTKYFSNLDYLPNLLVYTDILIKESLYELAKDSITKINTMEGYSTDRLFLTSKFYFFTQNYSLAQEGFETLLYTPQGPAILPQIRLESIKLLFICYIITNHSDFTKLLETLKSIEDPAVEKVYEDLYHLNSQIDAEYLIDKDDAKLYFPTIMDFLDKLLKIKEFDLFEKFLYILNRLNSNEILLPLAKLYYHNNFKDMAVKTILRSIKELDTIDHECLDILSRQI